MQFRAKMFAGILALVAIGGASVGYMLLQSETYTIALVSPGTNQVYLDGFKDGLVEYGYMAGKQVTYLEKLGVPIADLEAVLQEFVMQRVDLIFTIATPTALKAKAAVAGTDVPVVFAAVTNPMRSGVVTDYTRPGGNLTGVRLAGQMPKALELLLTIAPHLTRIWVPYNPNDSGLVQGYTTLLQAAEARGVTLVPAEMTSVDELTLAVQQMPGDMDAIFHLPSGFLNPHITKFVDLAITRKIPLASGMGINYQHGALLAFGSDGYKMSKQASRLAHQILQGSAPGDLPIETAESFLGLNVQTAEAINLEIPDNILAQAANILR